MSESEQEGDLMDARANTLLKRAEQAIADLRAHLDETTPEPGWRREEERIGSVLADVHRRGGRLSVDEWRDIGLAHGYDPRGLAGFFTGRMPSMRSDGDDRVLTARGELEAVRWERAFGKTKGKS